jgi:O-antigen/teichoic acid export membrane protein
VHGRAYVPARQRHNLMLNKPYEGPFLADRESLSPRVPRHRRFPTGPVARRLAGGTAANFLAKALVLLVQLATIPLLTDVWGVEGYGTWLILITIPTFIALSDLGFGSAAGIELTKAVARGDLVTAETTFQSVWTLLTLISVLIAILSIGVVAWIALSTQSLSTAFPNSTIAIAALMVVVFAVVGVQVSVLQIVYQATNRYAVGILIVGLGVPTEAVAMLCVASLGGGLVWAAVAMLAARLLNALWLYTHIHLREPWFHLGWHNVRRDTIRRLIAPSLATLSLSAATAVVLQGVVLALGWAAGAAAVAVFSAVRLLTRIPLQFSGLVTRASVPELTRAQVGGNRRLTRKLLLANVGFSLLVTIPFLTVMVFFGPDLLSHISGRSLTAPAQLFLFLSLAATFNAIWSAAGSALVAFNQHWRFAYWYLLMCAVAVAVPLVFGERAIVPTAMAMAAAEALTLVIVLVQATANVRELGEPAVDR